MGVEALVERALTEACDVVVIGAGIGGLTNGALLAKAGMDVCVVDMADRPGGYLMGFERDGFVFNTSTQWLNECSPGGMVRDVLDMLGPGAPEMPRLNTLRRYKGDSFDYVLTSNPDALRDELAEEFPQEKAGIYAFFALARRVGLTLKHLSKHQRSHLTMGWLEKPLRGLKTVIPALTMARYSRLETEEALSRYFSTDRVRQIFRTGETILSSLVPIGWAYMSDCQRPPDGGGKMLPLWLCDVLDRWDTPVHLRSRVSEIILEGEKVAGVRVVRKGAEREPQEIGCKYVVAACDLVSLFQKALPGNALGQAKIEKLQNADLYDSMFAINLGLDIDPAEWGLGEEIVFFSEKGLRRGQQNHSDPHEVAITILAPSVRDPSLAPAGKGTLSIQSMASIRCGDYWKTEAGMKRGTEYREFKEQFAEVLMDRVQRRLIPDLRDHIELCDIATPITHWRYTANLHGSIMGARPTMQNFRNGVASYFTPVKNLLVGGQWAECGGGVPLAVRAGVNSALLILKETRPEAFRLFSEVIDKKRNPEDCVSESLRTYP